MTTTINSKEIASEILKQLGGNKFISMTGSKNFGHGVNKEGNAYLSMHLSKDKSKAKYLTITLTSSDLYNVVFTMLDKSYTLVTIAEYEGVYDEMLQDIFTTVTGFDTHL